MMHITKRPPIEVPTNLYVPFNRISIESTSYCNRACSFCPQFYGERGRETMKWELFESICDQLMRMDYSENIHPYMTNEAMINPRILDEIKLLRYSCPRACIGMATNADLIDALYKKDPKLAMKKLADFYDAGVTVIGMNVYDDGEEQLNRYREIEQMAIDNHLADHTDHRWRKHSANRKYISVTDTRVTRGDRTGVDSFIVRNKQEKEGVVAPAAYCAEPNRHLAIRWDGKVMVCCVVDPTDDRMIVADLNECTLLEAWNSKALNKYRWYTQRKMRVLPGCNQCTFKMAYPNFIQKIQPTAELEEQWKLEVGQ